MIIKLSLLIVGLLLLVNIILFREIEKIKYRKNSLEADSKTYYSEKKDENHSRVFKILKNCYHYYGNWMESIIRLIIAVLMHIPCHFIRKVILKYIFGMKIGKKVTIYYGAEIRDPWNILVGDGTIIGDHAILDGRKGIQIGKNVNFSTGVWIWTVQHDVNASDFGVTGKMGKVVIGDRAWLSNRTIILPKVIIGEAAVVAAGAVVTKNCEDFSIYGGVPAKKIGTRSKDLTYSFSGEHLHFL